MIFNSSTCLDEILLRIVPFHIITATMIRGLINLDFRQRWTVKQAFDYIINI